MLDDDEPGGIRRVLLTFQPDPSADAQEADRSARQLYTELNNLDLDLAVRRKGGDAPLGAKGVDAFSDAFSASALLIGLSAGSGVVGILIETVRDWLERRNNTGRVSLTIGGDTLMLDKTTIRERVDLIDAFVRRHEREDVE